VARAARRRSGGFVITTNAAATPADASTTFATVRAVVLVMVAYELRRDVPRGVDSDELRVGSVEVPRVLSVDEGPLLP
jgi:hypothetical protein